LLQFENGSNRPERSLVYLKVTRNNLIKLFPKYMMIEKKQKAREIVITELPDYPITWSTNCPIYL